MITVPLVNGTIPFRIDVKIGAARIMLKPAPVEVVLLQEVQSEVLCQLQELKISLQKCWGRKIKSVIFMQHLKH